MTLRELIRTLEDLTTEVGDDAEVRLAQQPRWAFEYAIGPIVVAAPAADDEDEDPDPLAEDYPGQRISGPEPEPEPPVVYIGEGQQLGYLPGSASAALGWKG